MGDVEEAWSSEKPPREGAFPLRLKGRPGMNPAKEGRGFPRQRRAGVGAQRYPEGCSVRAARVLRAGTRGCGGERVLGLADGRLVWSVGFVLRTVHGGEVVGT